MKKVGEILETNDYSLFKPIGYNRGVDKNEGTKNYKVLQFQKKIDSGEFILEIGIIFVNMSMRIIEGHHRFQVLKANKLPIRYIILKDAKFNVTNKNEIVETLHSINSTNSSWSIGDLYKAALRIQAPVAVLLNSLIDKYENTFKVNDVLGIASGNFKKFKPSIQAYNDKILLDAIKQLENNGEIERLSKVSAKFRVAKHRQLLLRSYYEILFGFELDSQQLLKKTLKMGDRKITGITTKNEALKALTSNYNVGLTSDKQIRLRKLNLISLEEKDTE